MTGEARDVLAHIESRLGRIEAAITHNHREVTHRMTDIQKTIDADVATVTRVLADFAGEWQQLRQRLAMEAPQIDTSKLDAIASQASAMDAAWKAQLAGDAAGSTASGSTAGAGTASSGADSGTSGSTAPAVSGAATAATGADKTGSTAAGPDTSSTGEASTGSSTGTAAATGDPSATGTPT